MQEKSNEIYFQCECGYYIINDLSLMLNKTTHCPKCGKKLFITTLKEINDKKFEKSINELNKIISRKHRCRLSITLNCNYHCTYCLMEKESILNEFKILRNTNISSLESKMYDIFLITGGEPLTNPKLLNKVVKTLMTFKRIPKLYLYTNGSLLENLIRRNYLHMFDYFSGITIGLHSTFNLLDTITEKVNYLRKFFNYNGNIRFMAPDFLEKEIKRNENYLLAKIKGNIVFSNGNCNDNDTDNLLLV